MLHESWRFNTKRRIGAKSIATFPFVSQADELFGSLALRHTLVVGACVVVVVVVWTAARRAPNLRASFESDGFADDDDDDDADCDDDDDEVVVVVAFGVVVVIVNSSFSRLRAAGR